MSGLRQPTIYLVTDRHQLTPNARTLSDELRALDRFVEEAIAAGVDAIQIRERDIDAGALVRTVARATRLADGTPTRVLVNDRADVALAADAAGVHLRGDGPPARRIRAMAPRWTIGRSVHSAADAARAADTNYVLFGTVFPSESKPPQHAVTGLTRLQDAAARFTVPVIAIGGVTPANAGEAIAAGAAGIAAIGAFLPPGRTATAMGVSRAVSAFREAIATRLGEKSL